MSRIVICPRLGEEKTLLPGGEVRRCSVCAHAVRVTQSSLADGPELVCTPCAQKADLIPRESLTKAQKKELWALGYTEEQVAVATAGALRAYHAGRKS